MVSARQAPRKATHARTQRRANFPCRVCSTSADSGKLTPRRGFTSGQAGHSGCSGHNGIAAATGVAVMVPFAVSWAASFLRRPAGPPACRGQ